MDEPFEGLDPEICLDLVEMINSLKKNLKTFIIASHNISYVESISDQVILLDDGKIKDFIKMNGSRRYNIFFTSDLASCREVMERMNLIYDDINFPRVMVEFQGKVDDMLATLVMNGLRFNEVKRESLSETLLQLIR
jgi:ABC-type multidrug transport system ATPase subunit